MTSADLPRAILLVDDNVHGMVARRRVLLDLGYHVQTACSAQEALNLIAGQAEKFDVVVTDYRMPAMTGIELISRLKTVSPQTRTILLSALVEPWGMTEESTGADAVIPKSAVEMVHLTRAVQSLLARRVEKKPPTSAQRAVPKPVVKNG